jgi:flagellar basal-body rod modification protein FlgD
MDVTGTYAPTSGTPAAERNPGKQAATLDYNSFLQLLIAEMKNQDPTDPMKSSEYVAQFASFSSVEQAIRTNTKLDSMLTSFALSQADAVIGRTLTSADGTISGTVVSLRIASDGAVAKLADGTELALGAGVTIS